MALLRRRASLALLPLANNNVQLCAPSMPPYVDYYYFFVFFHYYLARDTGPNYSVAREQLASLTPRVDASIINRLFVTFTQFSMAHLSMNTTCIWPLAKRS